MVSGKEVPLPYAENLEKMSLPTVEEIVAAAKEHVIGNFRVILIKGLYANKILMPALSPTMTEETLLNGSKEGEKNFCRRGNCRNRN